MIRINEIDEQVKIIIHLHISEPGVVSTMTTNRLLIYYDLTNKENIQVNEKSRIEV